jgi:hypothetical protein
MRATSLQSLIDGIQAIRRLTDDANDMVEGKEASIQHLTIAEKKAHAAYLESKRLDDMKEKADKLKGIALWLKVRDAEAAADAQAKEVLEWERTVAKGRCVPIRPASPHPPVCSVLTLFGS